jgi:hypothetical protein
LGRVEHLHPRVAAYDRGVEVPPEHQEFARRAADALLADPMPTFENLSLETGVAVETLVHFALVRWASAGAEALLAVEPEVLRELIAARGREDWRAVAGIVDWLEAGLG